MENNDLQELINFFTAEASEGEVENAGILAQVPAELPVKEASKSAGEGRAVDNEKASSHKSSDGSSLGTPSPPPMLEPSQIPAKPKKMANKRPPTDFSAMFPDSKPVPAKKRLPLIKIAPVSAPATVGTRRATGGAIKKQIAPVKKPAHSAAVGGSNSAVDSANVGVSSTDEQLARGVKKRKQVSVLPAKDKLFSRRIERQRLEKLSVPVLPAVVEPQKQEPSTLADPTIPFFLTRLPFTTVYQCLMCMKASNINYRMLKTEDQVIPLTFCPACRRTNQLITQALLT